MALALWFGYKWWNSKKVVALLPELRKSGGTLVDVRSAAEFANGNAPGTINIPLSELGSRLGEMPKSSPVVVCCASGTRSEMGRSGKHAGRIFHAFGDFTQVVQAVAKGHFHLRELLEVVADDVLISHANAAMQLHRLLADKTHALA
jgi:phage shock protein E